MNQRQSDGAHDKGLIRGSDGRASRLLSFTAARGMMFSFQYASKRYDLKDFRVNIKSGRSGSKREEATYARL